MEEISLRNYAYLGDAVWELFVRDLTALRTQNSKELHQLTTRRVNAEFQHELLLKINEILTEDEQELVRRGRNLSIPIARKSNQADYRMATAFEVLIGWWYKHNKARLEDIEKILIEFL